MHCTNNATMWQSCRKGLTLIWIGCFTDLFLAQMLVSNLCPLSFHVNVPKRGILDLDVFTAPEPAHLGLEVGQWPTPATPRFAMAPVANPKTFCLDMKKTGEALRSCECWREEGWFQLPCFCCQEVMNVPRIAMGDRVRSRQGLQVTSARFLFLGAVVAYSDVTCSFTRHNPIEGP